MNRNSDINVIISTILTYLSPGTLAMNQSQLARLRNVNEDIRASMKPSDQVPTQKVFVPKYTTPTLSDYN